MKKIAICHLGGRVAPRYDLTDEMLVVTVNDTNEVVEKKVVGVAYMEPKELATALHQLRVTVLICGGVRNDWQKTLQRNKILLIDNVIGNVDDVLTRYLRDKLRRGDVLS